MFQLRSSSTKSERRHSDSIPSANLFLFTFLSWLTALAWYHPRLIQLFNMTEGPFQWGAIVFFIFFVELAWLYGFYNIGVIIFAAIYKCRSRRERSVEQVLPSQQPPVAILYATYNDFIANSALSCVQQDYPDYTVYLLDDSTDQVYRKQVDDFAALYPDRVRVVRRSNRQGFKAGNLNHALAGVASQETVFALADADEILPADFLKKMVPLLLSNPSCGFVQANHRCNRQGASLLAREMGDGIDIHWRWYQPLRNRYGFVMLLGHGAVLRRQCWEEVGGFPHLVSEDLAYAVRLREKGWKGTFAEDVMCLEDFPDSVRSFRIRFMKWTRGTCELLTHEAGRILRSRKISVAEKADILFPTLNLPLSMFYFLFIIDANVVLPILFGTPRPLTLSFGGTEFILPMRGLGPGFEVVFSADFFLITVLTMLAPVLCFVIEFWKRPFHLFKFLCRSTSIYAALGPIAALGVFSYFITKKATFFVTGDQTSYALQDKGEKDIHFIKKFWKNIKKLFMESHPNHGAVQAFELFCGVAFGSMAILLANLSLLGLAIAFTLQPLMHRISWEHPVSQGLVFLPFLFIMAGVATGLLGLFGLQPLFFGFGFHF